MSSLKVCSVFDVKAEAYGQPFTVVALGIASRDFLDALNKEDSPMSRHRADFDLYEIGSFNVVSGLLEAVTPPRLIMRGSDQIQS